MKHFFEVLIFCIMAVAIHVALMVRPPVAGAQAAGNQGDTLATLQAASAQMEQIVEAWEDPVEVVDALDTPPPVQPVMDVVQMPISRPDAAVIKTAAVALPDMVAPDIVPDLPIEAPAPLKPKPKPKKPEPKKATPKKTVQKKVAQSARPATAGQKAQKAKGSGGGVAAGKTGKASAASLSKAKTTSLTREWGAKIRSRIKRARRQVKGASGSGRVLLAITVSRTGQITSARVAGSSGTAAFDKAALTAVSRAGRMPAAPKGLTASSYKFTLPVDFK
jgi:protein TonB